MPEADRYCLITGLPALYSTLDFQQHILYHLDFQGDKKRFKINPNSPVLKGLLHSAEDVADSKDLILIAPCRRDSEGNVIKFIDDDFESGNYDYHEAGHSEDPSTITAVFNVVPDEPSLGGFRSAVDDTTYSVYYAGTGIVTLSAYRILVGRFPSYPWTYILWTLSAPRHDYLPVNYGSPSEAREQFMQWERLAKWEKMPGKKQERESLQIARWWFKFLTSKEHSLNDIWNDVWFGRGNLYVTVRPDRFPISEAAALATTTPEAIRSNCESKTLSALESLPLDIIHSLCAFYLTPHEISLVMATSKVLHSLVTPHVNIWVLSSLKIHFPFYLPLYCGSHPESPRLNEEVEWWEQQWSLAGYLVGDVFRRPRNEWNTKIVASMPWLCYAQACSRSRSMKNRKRLWRITGEIRAAAEEKGLLYPLS